MDKYHKSVYKMWNDFIDVNKKINNTRSFDVQHFENNKKDANRLVKLVKNGDKNGTASSKKLLEKSGEKIPEVGDISIITNWCGKAECIIKTIDLDIVPFKEVSKEFAKIEGEADRSLKYWREVHKRYFTQEFKKIGEDFNEEILVICEKFKLLYK